MIDTPAPRRGLAGYSVGLGVGFPSLAPAFLVAAITLAVWWRVVTFGFIYTWDDGLYYAFNPHLVFWSWREWLTGTQFGHWMPLTWLTIYFDTSVWGFHHPGVWHAENLALHTISAVLVYSIARRLLASDGAAVFVALLFAVHPLRMESVAWLAERKDVLMGVFFLLAVLGWLTGHRVWAFVAFVAACLSKSPAVFLPIMLLLIEWWQHDECCGPRLPAGLLRALAPFFAVSAVVAAIAFAALHATPETVMPWAYIGLMPRLLQSAYSEVYYAAAMLYPAHLSPLIEYTWAPSWGQPQYPTAVLILVLTTFVCLRTRRRWPGLTAGLLGYAVLVAPQAGLFMNGPQLVANRYSYLACLPLAFLAGAGVARVSRRWPRMAPLLAGGVVATFAVVTLGVLPAWSNDDALWTYAAEHEHTCTQCQDLASGADMRRGDLAAAIVHQRRAIAVSATTAMPRWERHWNLAGLLLKRGNPADADEAAREIRVYLAAVPTARRDSPADRVHIQRACEWLAHLERSL